MPAYPIIELHVHLEGTVRAARLLELARRNDLPLPVHTVEEVEALYAFRDFQHFVEVWILTTNVLRHREDFRDVALDYAATAAAHGAVYVEAIFSPAERVARGVSWADVFGGYCDGAEQAAERYGVEMRLTPDLYRGLDPAVAEELARQAVAHRDRGVVGLGLGGDERAASASAYVTAFRIARDGGLGSVPHAGENTDPSYVQEALEVLSADRIRHGIRAVDDPGLLAELAARAVVLDVCPTSNLRTHAVPSLAEHPLPALLAAGVRCTIGSDDPAMFGTDLGAEHALARSLGADPQDMYDAALAGALCDDATRRRLTTAGAAYDWSATG